MRLGGWMLLLSYVAVQVGLGQVAIAAEPPRLQPPPDPKAGQLIEWEGWSFRWQFRDVEGLMLTDVYFRGRKVLKAINLAEIYVPYATGQPRPEDFALGGFRANPMPLEIGRDCAGVSRAPACSSDIFLRTSRMSALARSSWSLAAWGGGAGFVTWSQ